MLSETELLLLNCLIYLVDGEIPDGVKVKNVVDLQVKRFLGESLTNKSQNDLNLGDTPILDNEIIMTSRSEWTTVLLSFYLHPKLMNYRIYSSVDSTKKNPKNINQQSQERDLCAFAVVERKFMPLDINYIFQGTMTVAGWDDNEQSFYTADTPENKLTQEYFKKSKFYKYVNLQGFLKGLPSPKITFSGHSKGGARALYLTVCNANNKHLAKKINRCVMFDSGIASQIVSTYSNELSEMSSRIFSIAASKDPVHGMNEIVEKVKYSYLATGQQPNIAYYHKPSILLNPKTGLLYPETEDSDMAKFLYLFCHKMDNTWSEEKKKRFLKGMMVILKYLTSITDGTENIIDVLKAMPELAELIPWLTYK
ncbi:MAG: DUF2974 domain-containing protein [Candidatus Ancillula sp.]|jgi:hypothetical protein|nr:DUF2974 domain-containing protein [Candidatus Ancillula sp.]